MDGVVHTYKARLVAKGYTQTPWIDYKETFSPVADIRAIRILIVIAAYYDYEIWQMDAKLPSSMDISMKRFAWSNLKRYYMENSKRGSIPMQEKLKLSKSQSASTPVELKRMQNVLYASAVGSIMYAVRCTRPDVLVYGGDLKRELRVSCYTDAGYLTDADDLKSQTGYKLSIAAFDASKEAVWVRKFIFGLGVVPTIEEPISMYWDNTGAIAIANESRITKAARHFCAKVHYLHKGVGGVVLGMESYDELAVGDVGVFDECEVVVGVVVVFTELFGCVVGECVGGGVSDVVEGED
nr:hypothetical protein [Tanacetum cinerariifolium]